jgi:RHS repeat-associated protein
VAGLTAHTFTGQPLDPHTGLMYYRARWYDPRLGRFIQADTVVPEAGEPQFLNRYTYAGNNPVLYNDPDGHCGPLCGGLFLIGTMVVLTVGVREALPPRPETIARAANLYGIPYPVMAGVLDAERALDTNGLDYAETAVYDLAPPAVVAQIVEHVFPNPGPGPGNIHVETARSVSAYFAEHYPDSPEMQLSIHELSTWEVTKRLADPQFNVMVAAAYVRQLADYRFGSDGEPLLSAHTDLDQWTLEDAIAVWHGYRYGIHRVSPNWRGMLLQDFQNRTYDLDTMVGVSMGLDKEANMYGAVPYFQRHVPGWR